MIKKRKNKRIATTSRVTLAIVYLYKSLYVTMCARVCIHPSPQVYRNGSLVYKFAFLFRDVVFPLLWTVLLLFLCICMCVCFCSLGKKKTNTDKRSDLVSIRRCQLQPRRLNTDMKPMNGCFSRVESQQPIGVARGINTRSIFLVSYHGWE